MGLEQYRPCEGSVLAARLISYLFIYQSSLSPRTSSSIKLPYHDALLHLFHLTPCPTLLHLFAFIQYRILHSFPCRSHLPRLPRRPSIPFKKAHDALVTHTVQESTRRPCHVAVGEQPAAHPPSSPRNPIIFTLPRNLTHWPPTPAQSCILCTISPATDPPTPVGDFDPNPSIQDNLRSHLPVCPLAAG